MNIHQEVNELRGEIVALRRDFHMHPEIGFEEYRTSEVIAKYLTECGMEIKHVAKTGVVGLLRGKGEGKTILLRADMDALPVEELTDLPYKSKNPGKMHACGHDGHLAMLLGAAKVLSAHKDELKGNIKFVFQPNEEVTGAMDVINAGVLEDPKVDAAFGIHLWSPLKSGQIGLKNGPVMAANEEFEITVLGKPGHTSAPQEGVDAITVASTIIQTLQSIQTRETDVLTPTSIVLGKIKGGTARNIVTDKVEMGGTIRFLYDNEEAGKKELLGKFERIVKGICTAMRAECKIEYIPSNPAVMNHPEIVELVQASVSETYGKEGTIVPYMCMGGDDFAYFTQRVPSTYCFLGIGNEDKGSNYPHHHPRFNIDEDILAYGTEIHIRTALRFLNL